MKEFEDWLKSEKKVEKSDFDGKDNVDKLALQNEYNSYLKKEFSEQLKSKPTQEEINKMNERLTASNEAVIKAVSEIGLALKAIGEKKGVNVEDMEKSNLVQFVEKNAENWTVSGKPKQDAKVAIKTITLKTRQVFSEVEKAAGLMTMSNITPIGTNGSDWSPLWGNYIDTNIYSAPKGGSTIMDDIRVRFQPGTENIYWSERYDEEGDAEWIAESDTKPLVDANYKSSTIKTEELALRWKFTTRLLFHAQSVIEDMADHARELMEVALPNGFLNGSGANNKPKGVIEYASAWVGSGALSASVKCPNVYDAILAGFTAIRNAKHKGIVTVRLNETEGFKLKTLKDGNSNYLRVPYVSEDGTKIDNVVVKYDNEVPAGKILIGVLSNYTGVVSEQLVFAQTNSNDDDFDKNLISNRFETYANGYLPSVLTSSIIYDDIATILSDIDNGEPCCCGCDCGGDDGDGGGGGND